MEDHGDEATLPLLTPLLRALEMLAFVARHLHPPDFEELMGSIGAPDEELKSAKRKQAQGPGRLSAIRVALDAASDAALESFSGLREAVNEEGDIRPVYRALRLLPKALEEIYPLAGILPSVNRFFLDPALRSEEALQQLFLGGPARDNTGVMQFGERERGGFRLYVPENYSSDRSWPLVMALHGGSGTGRLFLWSWLRDTRSRGAILVAPTSIGNTWALMGADADTPNLTRILESVRARWNVDPARVLLTGMSDGGTFSYVSGLESGSPFTHLAPVSAAFHPLLAQMADGDRMRGLPIHIIHGALDWMFPVELARQAQRALSKGGAAVTYREVPDLSHTYPRELNGLLLEWMAATPANQIAAHANGRAGSKP
jgi:phospholipase/carboxylesterase